MDVILAKNSLLEKHFEAFRNNTIGIHQEFDSPYGRKPIVYADWTASGRLYRPIEEKLIHELGSFVANTHTETTVSGTAMTLAYHEAREIIKNHVHASEEDVFVAAGTGMTGAINKFQRILGLRVPNGLQPYLELPEENRPVVFITHMEHHSNHTSWLETIAKVVIIPPDEEGLVDLHKFAELLDEYKHHKLKIASITACSNVTGILTPYHQIAEMIHAHQGWCFVDFACAAPYIDIDMHPNDRAYLDAIFFSPHKFLGGPGTSGVLIFNKNLYHCIAPDHPGGGTVKWTNPWDPHEYIDNIEVREDGGTPGFLQVIKTALAIRLKEQMGVENILEREHELLEYIFKELKTVPNLHILAGQHEHRMGVISFYIDGLHYNLGVKLLNDRYGIQTRGGCSCAGTYGHYLLHIDRERSAHLKQKITQGKLSEKPGWIRISIHPTTSSEEVAYIVDAVKAMADNFKEWGKDYQYNPHTNEFCHRQYAGYEKQLIANWFSM